MKLCYVYNGDAYFTDAPLTGEGMVWGDDWNDAPYEHNAGTPYNYSQMVKFSGPFDEPKDGHYNSPYSVEEINAGRAPWLWSWTKKEALHAGASVEEFKAYVRRNGGSIWVEELA